MKGCDYSTTVVPVTLRKMASFLTCVSSIFVLVSALVQVTLNLKVVTPPRVAAPLGRPATIPCQIDAPYTAIYWSRVQEGQTEQIVYRRDDNLPSGTGLTSGEFNINSNGGLVINYMRLQYETSYQCLVLGVDYTDASSITEVIAIVIPEVGPSIELNCEEDLCSSHLDVGDDVNLTCTSGEARPAVSLIWTNDQGTPLEAIFSDIQKGSLTGTFVTVSTISYTFLRTTTLACQAEGESIGKGNPEQRADVDLILRATEVPDTDPENVDASGRPISDKAAVKNNNSDQKKGKGMDLVVILVVVVAVSIGVVFILVVAVAVLYKKNKEYLDAISYSYCLSKDGYILFARSQFSHNQSV